MSAGQTIGLVGWKYLEPPEWERPGPGFFVPHYLVALLGDIAGAPEALKDATPVLMHPTAGLRSTIDADQIALHEWGAARASAAVWRIVTATQLGVSEMEAAARMGYAGEVLTAHVMYATGDSRHPVVGLRSPGGRILRRGDGAATAIGYWGGLSARAGLIAEDDEAFLQTAAVYFEALIAWYEAAEIGATGGEVFEAVGAALARGGLELGAQSGPPDGSRRVDPYADPPRLGRAYRLGHAVPGRHHSDALAGRMGAELRGRRGLRRRFAQRRVESPSPGGVRSHRGAAAIRPRPARRRHPRLDPAALVHPFVSAAVLAGAGPAPGAILRFAVALRALSIWVPLHHPPGLNPGGGGNRITYRRSR